MNDHKDELRPLVFALPTNQLEVLVRRFSSSDTDAAACASVGIAPQTFANWKTKPLFKQAYDLFLSVGPDIFKPLVECVYEAISATAVLEQRKLIETSTKDLDSREAAAKYQAIADVIDRAMPKRTIMEKIYTFKLEDVVPPLVLESSVIEGEFVAK